MGTTVPVPAQREDIPTRVMWLYGLHTVLNNSAYLCGFYLLPEGFMRGSPQVGVGEFVAKAGSFWPQLGLTLLFNLILMSGLIVFLNLSRINRLPAGYLVPIVGGVLGGLIAGTNSFAASDLSAYNAWEGMALGLSIGGLEMFAYCLVAAATAGLTMEQYHSWSKWTGEGASVRVRGWRELRLTKAEVLTIAIAIALFLLAAYRETVMTLAT
jgi:hypothetical protein